MPGILGSFSSFASFPGSTIEKITVHERIRLFRESRGMTHQEFADAVGVSRGAVQQWERGMTAPTRKRQPEVAKYMGISVSELMLGTPDLPALGGGGATLVSPALGVEAIAQAKCLVLRAAHDTFGNSTKCHIVVSGSSAKHAARSVDLLSTAGEVYATESAEDMRNYITHIAKAAGNPVMPVRH